MKKTKDLFSKAEYPKSETELALIKFADEETSRLMRESGIEPFELSAGNIHIVPPEVYDKCAGGGVATTIPREGAIYFNARLFRANPLYFGAVLIHEMLHIKAHISVQVEVEEKDNVKINMYRHGVDVAALQKDTQRGRYHKHFLGLHEAIVAETEKRLMNKLLDLPQLQAQKELMASPEAQEIKKQIAEKFLLEFVEDVIWVGKTVEDDASVIAYDGQRVVLDYLCTEIQKEFSHEFPSADQVFNAFLQAHFTGRLLPIARLVEHTFGEGSFRILGNMGTDNVSAITHLETLKKARTRQLRKTSS